MYKDMSFVTPCSCFLLSKREFKKNSLKRVCPTGRNLRTFRFVAHRMKNVQMFFLSKAKFFERTDRQTVFATLSHEVPIILETTVKEVLERFL